MDHRRPWLERKKLRRRRNSEMHGKLEHEGGQKLMGADGGWDGANKQRAAGELGERLCSL